MQIDLMERIMGHRAAIVLTDALGVLTLLGIGAIVLVGL